MLEPCLWPRLVEVDRHCEVFHKVGRKKSRRVAGSVSSGRCRSYATSRRPQGVTGGKSVENPSFEHQVSRFGRVLKPRISGAPVLPAEARVATRARARSAWLSTKALVEIAADATRRPGREPQPPRGASDCAQPVLPAAESVGRSQRADVQFSVARLPTESQPIRAEQAAAAGRRRGRSLSGNQSRAEGWGFRWPWPMRWMISRMLPDGGQREPGFPDRSGLFGSGPALASSYDRECSDRSRSELSFPQRRQTSGLVLSPRRLTSAPHSTSAASPGHGTEAKRLGPGRGLPRGCRNPRGSG
jgi:hypothetical protein